MKRGTTTATVLVIFCLLSIQLFGTINAAEKKEKKTLTKEEAEKRLSENWRDINAFKKDQLIKTISSEAEFNKYILRSPRNYTMYFLYTTQRNCAICGTVDKEFERAALRFYSLYSPPFYHEDSSPYPSSAVFFFRINIEQLYDFAVKMGVPTIPSVFHSAMTNKIGFPHKPNQYLHFSGRETEFNAYEIANFINSTSLLPVGGFSKPINPRFLASSIFYALILIPLFYRVLFHRTSRWTWFYFTLVVYGANMAGMIGNEVNGSPWYQANIWTGQTTYFYPSTQRQFRLEGHLASVTILVGALSLIYIVDGVKKIEGGIKKRLTFLFFLGVLLLSFNQLLEFFTFKFASYPYQYFYSIPYQNIYLQLAAYYPF